MIISHKHKFIFVKATKVAGTSMEVALGKSCGKDDIVTPLNLTNDTDDRKYQHTAMNWKGFREHSQPEEIRKIIGDTWDKYLKITIVRNPWDLAVSRFFWEKKKLELKNKKRKRIKFKLISPIYAYEDLMRKKALNKGDFPAFIDHFRKYWTNECFYFDDNRRPVCDVYLRFDNLQEDYLMLCKRLGISQQDLPHTKTKSRKEKKHYSEYYDDHSEKKIREIAKNTIDYFGYEFVRKYL